MWLPSILLQHGSGHFTRDEEEDQNGPVWVPQPRVGWGVTGRWESPQKRNSHPEGLSMLTRFKMLVFLSIFGPENVGFTKHSQQWTSHLGCQTISPTLYEIVMEMIFVCQLEWERMMKNFLLWTAKETKSSENAYVEEPWLACEHHCHTYLHQCGHGLTLNLSLLTTGNYKTIVLHQLWHNDLVKNVLI